MTGIIYKSIFCCSDFIIEVFLGVCLESWKVVWADPKSLNGIAKGARHSRRAKEGKKARETFQADLNVPRELSYLVHFLQLWWKDEGVWMDKTYDLMDWCTAPGSPTNRNRHHHRPKKTLCESISITKTALRHISSFAFCTDSICWIAALQDFRNRDKRVIFMCCRTKWGCKEIAAANFANLIRLQD